MLNQAAVLQMQSHFMQVSSSLEAGREAATFFACCSRHKLLYWVLITSLLSKILKFATKGRQKQKCRTYAVQIFAAMNNTLTHSFTNGYTSPLISFPLQTFAKAFSIFSSHL